MKDKQRKTAINAKHLTTRKDYYYVSTEAYETSNLILYLYFIFNNPRNIYSGASVMENEKPSNGTA